jgi:hypothetical protein
MSKVTKGTVIYFIDPADDSVVAVECATAVNPGTSPKDQIEDTCLESTERSYKPGMRTPGQGSITINADPTNDSHIRMHELYDDDTVEDMKWAIGWSDGTAAPTVDSSGDWVYPSSRTFFAFNGYISDFPFDFQLNSVVTTQVSIQRTQGDDNTGWQKKTA